MLEKRKKLNNLFLAILAFDTLLAVTKSEKIKTKKRSFKQYGSGGGVREPEKKTEWMRRRKKSAVTFFFWI